MIRLLSRRSSRTDEPLRIGAIWQASTSAANYRSLLPLQAMERRGHDVVWPRGEEGRGEGRRLAGVDVVHVYRRHDAQTQRLLADLRRVGVGIVWDNDDDFTAIPTGADFRQSGNRKLFAATVDTARCAHVVTTTTDAIAGRYREAGLEEVEVLPNALAPDAARRPLHSEGVVIGWVAGLEHVVDARRIPITDALERLQARHPEVRVECIGVDLRLRGRYRHDALVPFGELRDRMAAFHIGLAPLAQMPFNHARSDIKLKEYAACAVPWLASPVGPYAGLGEQQGGRLVADDGWFEALDELVRDPGARKRLGRKGQAWARHQTIEARVADWERVLRRAAGARRSALVSAARIEANVAQDPEAG